MIEQLATLCTLPLSIAMFNMHMTPNFSFKYLFEAPKIEFCSCLPPPLQIMHDRSSIAAICGHGFQGMERGLEIFCTPLINPGSAPVLILIISSKEILVKHIIIILEHDICVLRKSAF